MDDVALADELFAAVGQVRRAGRRIAGGPGVDLSPAQLELVRLVRRRPGVSVADAAAELGVAPNTVSTLVRHLTATDVLVRGRDADDGRVARLDLDPGVRRRVEQWRDRRTASAAEVIAAMSAEDRDVLARAVPVLTALAAGMGAR